MKIPNFKISPQGKLSSIIVGTGIIDFHSLCLFTRDLPYTRISDKNNLVLTLTENCGTCSSKHAFLKQVAVENHQDDVKLIVGVFKMNEINTPVIADDLNEAGLDFIPEAHCYLKYNDERFDFTKEGIDVNAFKEDILIEEEINPNQVGKWKTDFQKTFIGNWLEENKMNFSLEEVWAVRESCIAKLAE